MGAWQTVGGVSGAALREARLELHYAAQLVAALGATFLPPEPDDSHPNLRWDTEHRALLGRRFHNLCGALVPEKFRLELRNPNDTVPVHLSLTGFTLDEALAWLRSEIVRSGAPVSVEPLALPGYDLPDHPLAAGAGFVAADEAVGEEMARWFGNAEALLLDLQPTVGDTTPIRCWPHHFDLAFLRVLETDTQGELAKTVGCGLSPGDETYPDPYFYVSPWPYPSADALPKLDSGRWHTEGFVAAILPAEEIVAAGERGQEALVHHFLRNAYAAAERALR